MRIVRNVLLLLLVMTLAAASTSHAQERAAERAEAAPADSGIALDFQDTDIRLVITTLAEAGGLNVTYSALPATPVTLRTNQPVPRAAIRTLLRTIVESNGLSIVEEGGFLRIVPAASREPAPQRVPARPGSFRPGQQQQQAELYVYRVKHARATRLASTLQGLFGGATGFSPAGLSRSTLSDQLRRQQIPPGYPRPGARQGQQPAAGIAAGAQLAGGQLQIVADEFTNTILVHAAPVDWQLIQEAITALDIRPLQVLIEVLIAEVRRNRNFDLGIEAAIPRQTSDQLGAEFGAQITGRNAGDIILEVFDVGGVSAELVLSALSGTADVNILSRPVLLAQNNTEAHILIGSERPFIQVVRALPTDAAIRDQVIQYRDVGTSLTILPTINHDGYVNIQLVQEVSTATGETQFGAPVISTRQASTQLLVRDGRTVVIGGLIDRQQDRVRTGIPILKDIPLLGWLFGSTQKSEFHTELFLFLTPHVIQTDDDAMRLRESLEQGAELLRDRLPLERTIIRPDSVLPPDTSRSRIPLLR